jgi:putative membrane protein
MPESTELRDDLALYRTELANERTLLAYTRTSLALVAAGIGVLQLYHGDRAAMAAIGAIAAGACILLVGTWRFFRIRRTLRSRAQR